MELRSRPFTIISIPFYLVVAYLVIAAFIGLPFGKLAFSLLAPTAWIDYWGFTLFFLTGAIVLPELVHRERTRGSQKKKVGTEA